MVKKSLIFVLIFYILFRIIYKLNSQTVYIDQNNDFTTTEKIIAIPLIPVIIVNDVIPDICKYVIVHTKDYMINKIKEFCSFTLKWLDIISRYCYHKIKKIIGILKDFYINELHPRLIKISEFLIEKLKHMYLNYIYPLLIKCWSEVKRIYNYIYTKIRNLYMNYIYWTFTKICEFVTRCWNTIKRAYDYGYQKIMNILRVIKNFMIPILNQMYEIMENIVNKIKDILILIYEYGVVIMSNIYTYVFPVLVNIYTYTQNTINYLIPLIYNFTMRMYNIIITSIQETYIMLMYGVEYLQILFNRTYNALQK